jgi:hypothetical protein
MDIELSIKKTTVGFSKIFLANLTMGPTSKKNNEATKMVRNPNSNRLLFLLQWYLALYTTSAYSAPITIPIKI